MFYINFKEPSNIYLLIYLFIKTYVWDNKVLILSYLILNNQLIICSTRASKSWTDSNFDFFCLGVLNRANNTRIGS